MTVIFHRYPLDVARRKLQLASMLPEPDKYHGYDMSLVVRKPVLGVSDLVRHKPGCAVTEDS